MPGFAIACGHKHTLAAAESILNDGGNAADAAVAAALTAMVAEPVLAGFFGGGFAVAAGDGKPQVLDFFVQTPMRKIDDPDFRGINADFGIALQEFHIGTGSIATPGVAPGLAELHSRYGKMPFRDLTGPAAEAARSGVEITPYQARLNQIVGPILLASPEIRSLTCDEKGLLPIGALQRNADFADVLETYGREGPRFATEGEAGQALAGLAQENGHLAMQDLLEYRPCWRDPLVHARGGAELYLNPAPALGGTLIALSLELTPNAARPVDVAHAFAATSRARLETGDDTEKLLSPDLIADLKSTLADHPVSSRGTTHISIIDGSGLGVAMTLSNGEGCGTIVPGTGIQPNNMLGEEDLVPGDLNSWTPNRRLASMMCPLALRWPDGRLAMLGSGGSNRIRTALAQVLVHVIDHGRTLEEAISLPRLHVEGEQLDFEESGMTEEDRALLLEAFPDARGWEEWSMFFGGVHGAMLSEKGETTAAGDPRREGTALSG